VKVAEVRELDVEELQQRVVPDASRALQSCASSTRRVSWRTRDSSRRSGRISPGS
jgi:hypothetical protein